MLSLPSLLATKNFLIGIPRKCTMHNTATGIQPTPTCRKAVSWFRDKISLRKSDPDPLPISLFSHLQNSVQNSPTHPVEATHPLQRRGIDEELEISTQINDESELPAYDSPEVRAEHQPSDVEISVAEVGENEDETGSESREHSYITYINELGEGHVSEPTFISHQTFAASRNNSENPLESIAELLDEE